MSLLECILIGILFFIAGLIVGQYIRINLSFTKE